MGVDARHAAGRTVRFLRSLAERQYDRVWTPDFLHLTPDVQGFAVFHRGGLVLVYGAVSPEDPARWVFRMACVAGADVPDISGAMAWANMSGATGSSSNAILNSSRRQSPPTPMLMPMRPGRVRSRSR
ncbi:hypothetical protein ABZY58_15645 [Micromonospora tulbaghiae]|uniref:hypothetical protein n=1 Tax=Micromonospora tulbaghiae TaxID=479978 RepID=UPI0033B1A4A5